jgi:polyhydroxyalkanoate synthase
LATSSDTPLPPHTPDPQEIAKSFVQIAERSQKLVNDYLEHRAQDGTPALSDDLGLSHAFMDLGAALMAIPGSSRSSVADVERLPSPLAGPRASWARSAW